MVVGVCHHRKSGDIVEATFESDKICSHGKRDYNSNAKLKHYEGSWEVDKGFRPNGNGYMLYKDGQEYRGSWVAGLRNGLGQLTFVHEEVQTKKGFRYPISYKGTWSNDQIGSTGVLT